MGECSAGARDGDKWRHGAKDRGNDRLSHGADPCRGLRVQAVSCRVRGCSFGRSLEAAVTQLVEFRVEQFERRFEEIKSLVER